MNNTPKLGREKGRFLAKSASDAEAFRRPMQGFPNARSALGSIFQRLGVPERGGVLLPSYIGWSPREGSGVFDPVRQLESSYRFYPVDRELRVDVQKTLQLIRRHHPRVLLLIHYFGWPDPAFREVARLARDLDVAVVEDEAHAMYSDLVGGVCGREGKASVFSLHKMLPVDGGGLLVLNRPLKGVGDIGGVTEFESPGGYDLFEIARIRVRNARALWPMLEPLGHHLRPLWDYLPAGVIPQTFPVVLASEHRDRVYEIMNADGFGVVSLYHTMINEITEVEHPDSHWLSRHILNLPVHQDVQEDDLEPMVHRLSLALREAAR